MGVVRASKGPSPLTPNFAEQSAGAARADPRSSMKLPGDRDCGGGWYRPGSGGRSSARPPAGPSTPLEATMPLLERDDSILIVIDLQPKFWSDRLEKDDAMEVNRSVAHASWLAGTAMELGVPAVLTEENPARNGPTAVGVLLAVGRRAPVFTKPVFGLADCPEIMAAIAATGRRTAVLCGFETDVCVTHSAVGLMEAGYRVVVAVDAVYSPAGAQSYGLARLHDLGAELVHCKGVYYDWIRTLDDALQFEREHRDLAEPPGFWI
jgi:nicotinamidase-related amidase